jgi:hypothetical protein
VENLCGISDLVFFSAAIPGQGGTHHVNERWLSYWEDLFAARGYRVFDALRNTNWHDQRVEWWYRQNAVLVVRSDRKDLVERIEQFQASSDFPVPRDCVHPEMYLATKHQNAQMQQRVREMRSRIDGLEGEVDSLLNSRSWRLMSAPRAALRRLKNLIRAK